MVSSKQKQTTQDEHRIIGDIDACVEGITRILATVADCTLLQSGEFLITEAPQWNDAEGVVIVQFHSTYGVDVLASVLTPEVLRLTGKLLHVHITANPQKQQFRLHHPDWIVS